MKEENCIFCKIALRQEKAHIVWEDEKHVAFLSIFPNTKGFTVVITKDHFPSYNFDLPDKVLCDLTVASKTVSKLLDKSFEDVGRTGMMMEGFGVDHVHTKLFPMHGTGDLKNWKPIHSNNKKYFDTYEGYISSHDFERANDKELAMVAELIRKNNIA
ncbi:HIT family protein [Pontibacter diazotrophicus]|uniref:HIT family protein n=1 Tax=Pontibacter diazotrophicus TaxID=1400979 RepID=A0A3D8LGZ6_9BACT|nr:HIT family protein [Pontibacter diazotrophicus]RDV16665.1 HIT family protein [Pontibacter diazotrophicus]